MNLAPYPPNSTHRNQKFDYQTVAMIPAPAGLKAFRDEEEETVACLLLQELRGNYFSWKEGENHRGVYKPLDAPYETRVVPGFIQLDSGEIWEDDSIRVNFG